MFLLQVPGDSRSHTYINQNSEFSYLSPNDILISCKCHIVRERKQFFFISILFSTYSIEINIKESVDHITVNSV